MGKWDKQRQREKKKTIVAEGANGRGHVAEDPPVVQISIEEAHFAHHFLMPIFHILDIKGVTSVL